MTTSTRSTVIFPPRSRAARRKPPSLIDVALDPAQRAAVERPPGGALLVLGEAGHGKTTVALHRMAHLWRSPTSSTPSRASVRAAVVVPTEGLARLLQPLLRRLGVDVQAVTYDRFASARARRAFRRLPPESEATPPAVMRLKRHPAIRLALEALAVRAPGLVDDDADALARRGSSCASRGDLQHLFGDMALLERVARAGGIPSGPVAETLDRTRIQFSLTAEEEFSHVTDRQRLVAVDHRALDEGTPHAAANTVDVEDYAVLCELDALRAASRGRRPAVKRRYDVLVIDEAQELAPLELALLGRTLKADGTLIVAGDANQQTGETATFLGWAAVMRELGRSDHEAVQLGIGYRCAPDVVALARAVIDPVGAAGGADVVTPVHVFDEENALGDWLARGLEQLRRSDPRASVAVVSRSPRTARRLAAGLQRRQLAARLVFDGRFLPRGVQVSTVEEVKGLEFDFVVVPDAAASDYPDSGASRRAMYVAVTRARSHALLACVGRPSDVLPRAVARG